MSEVTSCVPSKDHAWGVLEDHSMQRRWKRVRAGQPTVARGRIMRQKRRGSGDFGFVAERYEFVASGFGMVVYAVLEPLTRIFLRICGEASRSCGRKV